MKTTMKRICAAAAKAAVALAVVFCAATPALAATKKGWKGSGDRYWTTSGNWKDISANADGYFLRGGEGTTLDDTKRTILFKQSTSISVKVSVESASTSASHPYSFLADADGYGLTTSANFDVGTWKAGHLAVKRGTYQCNQLNVGGGDGTSGDVVVIGGNGNNATVTATGKVAINKDTVRVKAKGKLICKNWAAAGNTDNNTGRLVIDGGEVQHTANHLTIGDTANSTGYVGVRNGGKYSNTGSHANGLCVGQKGVATLEVDGGTIDIGTKDFRLCDNTNGKATVTVNNGGVVIMGRVTYGSGTGGATITVDGGTIKAAKNSTEFIPEIAKLDVYVGAGGAIFDTDGYAITVSEPLNAATGVAGDLTVTGGGSAAFAGMGDLAGALTVADGTGIHWFDQDGAVSATPGFTSLALGAGSTVYLSGDATGVDALPATITTTATTENKANIAINFSALPATGSTYTLFPAASADVFNVQPSYAGITLPCEVAVEDGNIVLTIVAEDYTWNGSQTNWGDVDAWTKGGAAATWADGNNAIFNTASATATLAANASPAKIEFSADATVDGTATLTAPIASVAQGVTATVTAPTAGTLEKTGAGTLTLGASRTAQTTLAEGTLAMADGATVDPSKLTLGTDAAKPVTLDYGGQTLSGNWTDYLASGINITLTNGTFSTTQNPGWNSSTGPKTLTIAKGATMTTSERFTWNTSTTVGDYVTNYVNIAGGALVSTKNNNNWFVQDSRSGTLKFDVSDGGLLELSGQTYILPCRDNTTENDTPSVLMTFNDSTFRVNNKNLFLGYDNESGARKNPLEPVFELAMTNSTLDVGTGYIKLGHNVVQSNHGGHSTADFENSVITAQQFAVYYDRPGNAARFNNSTIVLTAAGSYSIEAQADCYVQPGEEWAGRTPITVGTGGLTVDTQGFSCGLQANLRGDGAVTKVGTGILNIFRDQTSTAPFVCEEGETYLCDGRFMARPVTVKNGAKFTVNGSNTTCVASIALEAGAELRFDNFRERQAPLLVGALTLPAEGKATLTFGGTPAEGKACELLTITNAQTLAAADLAKLELPAGYENYSLGLSADGKTLYIVGGSSLVWTGAGADTAWTTDANWLNGAAPDGTVDPSFLEGLISGSRTVTFDDASIAKYVWVDGGTAANPIVFAKADGGAGRLVIDNNYLIVGQKSSEAALTIAPGMNVVAKLVRVGGLASSVSRLTVQGSLHTTSHVCVGSNGAEGEVTGIIDIDGGAVTNDTNDLVVGDFAGPSSANYSVVIRNGGEYNSLPSNGIRVSAGADGTIAITNGTLKVESGNINLSDSQAGRGTLILGPGALVVTKRVTSKASTSTGHKLVFDGGTLKAVVDDEWFIDSMNNSGVARVEVEVGENGGTIDTAGKNVAFRTPAGGVGGLAVTGGGELTFNNKNGNRTASAFDYEGATAVAAGTAIRSGADVTTFAGGLTLASGAMVNVGLVSSGVPCFEADDIAIASGVKVVLDAAAFPAGTYPILRKTGGAFTAGDLANLTLDASAYAGLPAVTRLALGGTDNDSICLVVDHAIVPVANRVTTSPTLTGNDVLVGAGGFDLQALTIPENATLVFDPIKTPIYVYGDGTADNKKLTFGSGAKLALTPNYAGMTLGRIDLIAFKTSGVVGLPENLNDIFDASSIAPGAEYAITVEDVPDSSVYRVKLVLTVGDYENKAKEIRLTCIGDSITQGTGSGKTIGGTSFAGNNAQYRMRIAARLAANGYKPKMLGIWKINDKEATNVVYPEDWRWHSGISGDRIKTGGTRGGVRDNLHVYLDAAGNVDALTLLIGTNDIGAGDTAEDTYEAYTNLVFDIARQRPLTKIIGSTILDRDGAESANHAKIVAFNALLKADYAAGRLPANYTMLDLFEDVPLTTGETGNFFDDLLHPHWVGCSAIVEGFAAGIMNALPFATYAGPIETEATDEPEAALGAAGIAATVEGAGLAAYTNGMSHIFTIETTATNNSLYGSSPYTEIVTPAGLDRNVKKAGYFMELVRKGTSHHRYVWVDFDATGKTLDEIDFPWNGENLDFVAEKLHVFSNDGSIHNVAADDDTVKGAIEGTYWNYSGAKDDETVPEDVAENYYGWNDTLGSSGGYGGFQAHRIFGEGEHWHGGEVLFAWNAWGLSNTSNNDELGIGSFFYSQALGGSGNSMDYTFTKGATDGAADTLSAAGYQVVRLEIWAELVGEPRHGFWTGASGDFDDPKNWEDGQVPVAGDNLDFSLLTAAATVNANVDAAFGAVTMGSQRVTFTNDYMKAASFSDMSKVAVGANSTVTITENCTQTPLSVREDMVYSIGAGGKLVFAGTFALGSGANDGVNPQTSVGSGVFVVNRLENNVDGRWIYVMTNGSYQKWVVGPGGIGGTTATGGLWLYSNTAASAEFQANTNDFEVALPIVFRTDADYLTFNTTGWGDGEPHKITLSSGIYNDGAPLNISGTGKVVANFYGTANYGSYSPYSGEVKVNGTATLAINPGKRLTTGKTTFAAGTTLEVTPVASGDAALLGTLAFTGSGTVTLKAAGDSALDVGEYTLFTASSGLADDILSKFTLDASAVSGGRDAAIFRDGVSIKLYIGNRAEAYPYGVWMGGMDANFSSPANWKNGLVPRASDVLDFSSVGSAKTVNVNDVDAAFGAVTMGSGVVTFNGTLTATSFSDTSKVAVGANSTVTLDGDLMFTGSGTKYVVYKVDAGGKFIVTGKVGLASGASCVLQTQDSPGTGIIVAGSLVNDSANWMYVARDNNATTQYWAIGPGGITGTATSVGLWVYSNNKVNPVFQPNTNDFTVSLWTVLRESAKSWTYNTTGLDGLGHTITLDAGFSDKTAPLYVTGKGEVVVNHVTKSFGGKNAYSGPVTVKDTATLAINAGKQLTTGAISFEEGTTLALPQTGTVAPGGNLTLAAGTTIAYTLSAAGQTTLDVTGKTLTRPAEGTVVISVAGKPGKAVRSKTPYTLISGANLTEDDLAKFTLENLPDWVRDEYPLVIEDGDLKLYTKNPGLCIMIK